MRGTARGATTAGERAAVEVTSERRDRVRGAAPAAVGAGRGARGQGAHAGRREGGCRGDERAAGQGAHICSWRGGVPGRAPGRTAGAGPDVLEGPRARVGASTSR